MEQRDFRICCPPVFNNRTVDNSNLLLIKLKKSERNSSDFSKGLVLLDLAFELAHLGIFFHPFINQFGWG